MLITVTQEDIDQGRRKSTCNCPIARALKRQTGQIWVVASWRALRRTNLGLLPGSPNFSIRKMVCFTAEAREFIKAFDATGKGVPFSFEFNWKE